MTSDTSKEGWDEPYLRCIVGFLSEKPEIQLYLNMRQGGSIPGGTTPKQKRFFEAYTKAVGDKAVAKQEVVNESMVTGGSYVNNILNMSDVQSFDKDQRGTTGMELVIHETFEQLSKAKHNLEQGEGSEKEYTRDHKVGSNAEEYVGGEGYKREEHTDKKTGETSETVKLKGKPTIKQTFPGGAGGGIKKEVSKAKEN